MEARDRARVFHNRQAPPRHASRHFSTSPGRISDGKISGVACQQGGKAWVEGCQIWGNKVSNVYVQGGGSGSQAIIKGCECANSWDSLASPGPFMFCLGGRFHRRPVFNALHPPWAPATANHRLGRIHGSRGAGVVFLQGVKGRVEDCRIWGCMEAGLLIDGCDSKIEVAGCKCACDFSTLEPLCWLLSGRLGFRRRRRHRRLLRLHHLLLLLLLLLILLILLLPPPARALAESARTPSAYNSKPTGRLSPGSH